jgi:TPR repeat protein
MRPTFCLLASLCALPARGQVFVAPPATRPIVVETSVEKAKRLIKAGRYDEALASVRPDADRGDRDAQTVMGFLYTWGLGVAKDKGQAFDWYRKAALQQQPVAQFELAFLYINNPARQGSFDETIKWLRMAADNGHTEAQFWLGTYELSGGIGAGPNPYRDVKDGLLWLERATRQQGRFAPSSEALGTLGFYYLGGFPAIGVAPDLKKGLDYLERGARLGDIQAQEHLAEYFSPQEPRKAYVWGRLLSRRKNCDPYFVKLGDKVVAAASALLTDAEKAVIAQQAEEIEKGYDGRNR